MSQRVVTRTYVDAELKRRFEEQYPMQGSLSWLLETALAEILDLTDGQPPLQKLVRSSIRSTLLERRQARALNDSSEPEHPVAIEPLDGAAAI